LLEAQGIECAVCNPRRIRHFAISTGQRSKTDKADAKAILAYALHTRPEPSLSIAAVQQQLAFLLRQREKSIKQRVALENQLTALAFIPDTLALVSEQLDQLLSAFRTFEAELDHSIQQLIQGNQDLQVANRILRSMDGVGKVTSTLLCSSLDTILDCNAKQLTALAGLAPAHRESGISVRGKSRIDKQGRPLMRKCLYLAAMAASRSCPHYISVKERMKAAGKPGKVILIAIARQLLLQAQKLLKNHFAANTHPQLA
jgi:transposase